MAKKAANGTGHTYQRKDGRWEAKVTTGYDPATGKQLFRSIYGKTQKEVEQKKRQLLTQLENGTFTQPQKITVAEWMKEWLSTFARAKNKPYTLASYSVIIDNHITKHLGKLKLQSLRGIHVQRMYNSMIAEGLSAKTVKNIGAVLHKAMNIARRQHLIATNPADDAELPRVERHEITPLRDEDVSPFMAAIEADCYCNAFAVTLLCGTREGETLGLSWDHVNFEAGTIEICQQLQRDKTPGGQHHIVPFTKTDRPRTITPPPLAFDYLRKEQLRQKEKQLAAGPAWSNPDNLCFTNDDGGCVKLFTFYKHFKQIVASIGRPDLRPHDLRHTAATVAIANGGDVKSVQSLLGHSTPTITLSLYTHASEKMARETASKVQGYYEQKLTNI